MQQLLLGTYFQQFSSQAFPKQINSSRKPINRYAINFPISVQTIEMVNFSQNEL